MASAKGVGADAPFSLRPLQVDCYGYNLYYSFAGAVGERRAEKKDRQKGILAS